MKKVIKKKTVLIMIGLLFSVFVGNVSAAIDRPFNYTITATGTEDSTTYPDQEFTWTVTTTGTETWTEYGFLGSRYVSVGGYKQYYTYYLYPSAGSTITNWNRTVHYSDYGGGDAGTYISYLPLVIRAYSGGYSYSHKHWWLGSWHTHYYPGYYSATYRIYGDRRQTATVTATQSGSGTVNPTEGNKFIATFSLSLPPPQYGGTVTFSSRTVTDDNPNVTTSIVIGATAQVYASTEYSETVTQAWSDTETGSSSVNFDEGDKYITTSILVAPNNDTTWSVTDDSDYVDTWMDGNKLYAGAINQQSDVTSISQINKFGMRFDRRTGQFSMMATWTNIGAETFSEPLQMVIEGINSGSVTVANADGTTPEGKPYYDYSTLVGDGKLDPGETSEAKRLVFNNPTRVRFTFDVSFWATSE